MMSDGKGPAESGAETNSLPTSTNIHGVIDSPPRGSHTLRHPAPGFNHEVKDIRLLLGQNHRPRAMRNV